MEIQIADGFYMLPAAKVQPFGGTQVHVNSFLVRGSRKSLLIDAGAPSDADALVGRVATLLGDAPLDYLFLSHMDVDHIGAVDALLRRYPGLRMVGGVGNLSRGLLHGWAAKQFAVVWPGEQLDLGGRHLVVSPAFLEDGGTQWLFEPATGTAFTSDAFGLIQFGPVVHFADEVPAPAYEQGFLLWHLLQFSHLPLIDKDRFAQALSRFRETGVRQVVSTHGPAIRRDLEGAFKLMAAVPTSHLPPPPPFPEEWKL